MALAPKGSIGGGLAPFFNGKEHLNDLVLIIEPKSVKSGIESKFKNPDGSPKTRTIVNAKVTTFLNEPQLEEGRPTVGDFAFGDTLLAADLAKILEEDKSGNPAVIASIKLIKNKSGTESPVFREPEAGVYEAAAAYYEKREAGISAAMESAPDFD